MKEIKFRAIKITGEVAYFTLDELIRHDLKVPAWVYEYPAIDKDLYIGLKDKDGVDIYQHDKIKYRDADFEVTWCNGGFKLMEMASMLSMKVGDGWISDIIRHCQCHDNQIGDFEIIENPELLTDK